MQLSLASNLRDLERDLSDAARRQLPFAASLAINEMAEEIRKAETDRLDETLDRPTAFTKKAWAVRRSTRSNLSARVYAKPAQAAYLGRLEEGGTLRPKGRALVMPQAIRVNRHGNIARGAVKRVAAKPATFSGTPKGGGRGAGIWERRGGHKGKLVKLVSYADRATYKPTLGFTKSARARVARRFPAHLEAALCRAWSTRR